MARKMTRRWILMVGMLLVMAGRAPEASAASGYDLSDVWWNPAEPGWGVGIVQQRDTIFATLLVYDTDRKPVFYVAALGFDGLTPQTREVNFSGDLYVSSGPWFGAAPFSAASVVERKVGTMEVHAPTMTSATLTYTIDGVTLTKSVERMTFRIDDYAGDYASSSIVTTAKCTNPADDGTRTSQAAMQIVQEAGAMTIVVTGDGKMCTYAGPYAQAGRLGSVFSNYTCTNGEAGALLFEEMNVQRFGVMGRLFGADNRGCHIEGRFAAVRP